MTMLIRPVKLEDAEAITAIYNEYVEHTVVTFDTEPWSEERMRMRIIDLSTKFPYFVCEVDGELAGYCYAHAWKERAAYRFTLETTIYLSPAYTGRGIGTKLMEKLIEECSREGYHALIACITEGNEASNILHTRFGFKQVSCFKQVGLKFDRWLDVIDYELLLEQSSL